MHFRPALSADLGYCSLDPKRRPLTGREQRGCWEGRPIPTHSPTPIPVVPLHRLRARPGPLPATEPVDLPVHAHREFVPIETMTTEPIGAGTDADTSAQTAEFIADPDVDWSERTSLVGDGPG